MEFKIIIKKLKNKLSPEEQVIFEEWYHSDPEHQEYFKKVSDNYFKKSEPVATKNAWKLIRLKLNKNKSVAYWEIAVAASIITIIGLFSFFDFISSTPFSNPSPPLTTLPVEIETGKAILTLGDGNELVLTNSNYQNNHIKVNGNELVYKASTLKPSNDEVVYNYLTVPRGGTFFIKLADGTKVWLNSDSKLKYPVEFKGASRKVELVYGEAYFEVSPSSLHHGANFIVKTQNQVVEVLGTEFNIKAYQEDEAISTTLVEGKVTLTNSETRKREYLIPNQQAAFNPETNEISIQYVDTENIIAWRNGILKFKNKSLEEIMLALSRWYDLEVTFEDETIKNRKFNGVFRKKQKIENILESIEKTQEAAFRVEGRKIIVENYPKK